MASRNVIAACSLMLLAVSAADAQEVFLPAGFQPRTVLALPADSKVQSRWVVPPSLTPSDGEPDYGSLSLSIDAGGQPWLMRYGSRVFNPLRQHVFLMSQACSGFACIGNGAMVFATESEVGCRRCCGEAGR